MKKRIFNFIVCCILLLCLTACTKTETKQESNNNVTENGEKNTSKLVGKYKIDVYYSDNNEVKPYYFYTNNNDFVLEDNYKCSVGGYKEENLSDLILGYDVDEKVDIDSCTWKEDGSNISITWKLNNKEPVTINGTISDNGLFFETNLSDDHDKWEFKYNNIVGFKLIKSNDDENYEIYNALIKNHFAEKLAFEVDSKAYFSSVDESEKCGVFVIYANDFAKINDLIKVKKDSITFDVEGTLSLNAAGTYPVKLHFYENNKEILTQKMVFAVVPSLDEQDKWWNKYYVDSRADSITSISNSNFYAVPVRSTICLGKWDNYFYTLLLKNGAKCENYHETTQYFSSNHFSNAHFITYKETNAGYTPSVKEMYDFYLKNAK